MPGAVETGREFLDRVYKELDYEKGMLFPATRRAPSGSGANDRWVEIGDWLTLASRMGADSLFFVGNEPVLVFKELNGPIEESQVREIYRQAWCMAGPQCLFLAFPGELRVYALTEPPVRWPVETRVIKPLEVVRNIADVAEVLNRFSREEVESGRLFGDSRFGDEVTRADRRLVSDLRVVRRALISEGLLPEHAHALIGRSIFIRYLEDRNVLTPEYFSRVAEQQAEWRTLLAQVPEKPDAMSHNKPRLYDRVLRDHNFTYALFHQLSVDFNGDMFPRDQAEYESVSEHHLGLLRHFLLGDVEENQPELFFWAYDFEIIPISLISSIYEEFYRSSDAADDNTHYTPSALVDEVLSRVLTPELLSTRPKIIDPACGSGIFLIEAFRRIVRFESQRSSEVNSDFLRGILRDQIVGIELNAEAARVAAFSLYLALLNYQEPPEILRSTPLPHLVYDGTRDNQHYGIIFAANAFALTNTERSQIAERLGASRFSGRTALKRFFESVGSLPFELGDFDVVIGNPPWLEAGDRVGDSDIVIQANRHAIGWSDAFNLPVGDRSYSQLFIHRALSLLKVGGTAGLLVSAKVIWNQRKTSKDFRGYWLDHSHVREVINFTHARRVFFHNAIAPFIFVRFEPRSSADPTGYVVYWSARLTRAAQQLRSVVFTRIDRRLVHQNDLRAHDFLWKTYWWGSHRDAALVSRLSMESTLLSTLKAGGPEPGYGFQRSTQPASEENKNIPAATLASLPELISDRITWYGELRSHWFGDPPEAVKRQPDPRLYQGQRLLATTGIKALFGPCVRLEDRAFSFRHTMYCIPLPAIETWKAKLVLATIWSSLGRYYLFMTSGSWGGWFDKVTAEDLLGLPVRLFATSSISQSDAKRRAVQNAISAVDAIRSWRSPAALTTSLLGTESEQTNEPPPDSILVQLEEAIFELFDLAPPERDLVRDFFTYSFDLLNRGPESNALGVILGVPEMARGTYGTLHNLHASSPQMATYIRTFLDVWNPELYPEGEFRWMLVSPPTTGVIAVAFETQYQTDTVIPPEETIEMEYAWPTLLARCEAVLQHPISGRLYMDQFIRVVTETSITLIKRNEQRLWSSSAAREDADASLVQAMQLPQTTEIV